MGTYSDAARRIPGALVNLQFGLFLRFMLNPTQIDVAKRPNYESRDVPGWRAPQRWWTGGAEKTISFTCYWDKSASRNTGGINLFVPSTPGVGLRDVIATVESFLEPKQPTNANPFKDLPQAVKDLMSLPDAYLPPPVAFFVYGTRIWKCRVLQAPISEVVHDQYLNPMHISVNFSLGVIEEGAIYRSMTKERNSLALVASGSAGIDLIPELFGDLLPGLISEEGLAIPSAAFGASPI